MNVLILLLISGALLLIAARVYGRLTARWLGEDANRPTPAQSMADGRDYVPTNTNVVFAHHFSAIAGAGPIVGPTMAILYGYLPVWLWIILGGIFIGAVHDFSTLFVSLREKGRSMAEIARNALGERGFVLFISFAVVMIMLVTSAFLAMTAMSLTSMVPLKDLSLAPGQRLLHTFTKDGVVNGVIGGIASTSVIIITLFSPILGWLLFRRRMSTWLGYLIAAAVALGSVYVGLLLPIRMDPKYWMVIISIYVLFAAGLPVWLVLQPRDFINVQILYAGILAMIVGLVIGGLHGMTMRFAPVDLAAGAAKCGAVWPMLFVTVACGAISGFHALVATGTTCKQLAKESHARIVGFNGMLLESLLAIAALLVIGVVFTQHDYQQIAYPAVGKSNPILVFSFAMGSMLQRTMQLPTAYGTVFGILLVEGFVITTLDAAVRLNRYLFEELWPILFKGQVPAVMRWPWFNSALSVVLMLLLAWNNGFNLLWPLFATGNQMLAAISLIAISAWLLSRKRQAWFTLLPAFFMIVTTLASLLILFRTFFTAVKTTLASPAHAMGALFGPGLLLAVDIIMLILAVGVVFLAISAARRFRTQVAAPASEAVNV